MIAIHPQYIKDADGNESLVVLPAKEFEAMMESLEEMDDIVRYDQAKKEDDGERVPFSEYLNRRRRKNGQV
jgi:PHD/YefM family antitoxin component YafN of YafNO toxin-antitoxin module